MRVIGDLETLVDLPRRAGTGEARVSPEAWAGSAGRALIGVLIETGLTRGSGAAAGEAWPDRPTSTVAPSPSRRPDAEIFADWSTPRLASLVFGRVRSVVPSVFVRPLNLARRVVVGGSRRRGGRRRGGPGRPSVDLAVGQRARRRVHELEEAE